MVPFGSGAEPWVFSPSPQRLFNNRFNLLRAMARLPSFLSSRKLSQPTSSLTVKSRDDPSTTASSSTSPLERRPTSRFLSFRSRSSSRPNVLASSRTESDPSTEEPSQRYESASEVPRLDLGFDVGDDVADGLDMPSTSAAQGKKAVLSEQEIRGLDEVRLNLEEATLGWRWFGNALKALGESLFEE